MRLKDKVAIVTGSSHGIGKGIAEMFLIGFGYWVLSRYGEENYKKYKKKFKDIHLKGMKLNQPLRKIGRPKDIAYGAVYLGSEESRFVTGSNLMIDGGLTSLLAEPPALDLKELHDYYESSQEMKE